MIIRHKLTEAETVTGNHDEHHEAEAEAEDSVV